MTNLKVARRAIQEELAQAKKTLAYYEKRVPLLEATLQQLDGADGGTKSTPKKVAKGTSKAAKASGKPAATKKAQPAGTNGLPPTGGNFWLKLVTTKPRTAVEIVQAAIRTLKLDPEKDVDAVKGLKSRVGPGLQGLVEQQQIKDSGTGRERTYQRAA